MLKKTVLSISFQHLYHKIIASLMIIKNNKFQIEIDLHSKESNKYYGIFLGVSDNTHRPTARKCILTDTLITSFECLSNLFEELKISNREAQDMLLTKYWDMKTRRIKEYVISVNM